MNASRTKTGPQSNPAIEFVRYVRNIRNFQLEDWVRYTLWIGTISSLLVGVTGFILLGYFNGVVWPGYVWFILLGTAMFVGALKPAVIG